MHKRALKIMEQYSKSSDIEEKIASLRKQNKDDMLNATLKAMPTITKIKEKLDKAGSEATVKDYLVWMGISLVVTFLLYYGAFGFGLFAAFLFAVVSAYMFPAYFVNRKIIKRRKKFLVLLPDALELIVRGLRSGLPVTESFTVIKDEIEDPVKSVFAEIAHGMKIGVPFEEALFDMARKLEINEFNFFAISIALQRETGGNLAEILENLSETIRSRATMQLKIKAISSEARMSSYIVGALPFLVTLALMFMSPDYLTPLVEDIKGNIAVGIAGGMFGFGMFIMNRMTKFEI